MMAVIYIVIGVALGALVTVFFMQRTITELRLTDADKSATLKLKSEDLDQKSALLSSLQQEARQLSAQCEAQQKEISLMRQQADEQVRKDLDEKEKAQERAEKEAALRQQQFQEQLNVVREQFQNMASKVLTQTSDRLQQQNREHMTAITQPINEHFVQLQQAIRESDKEQAKSAASLSEQLRQVSEQAERMDRTATKLTNALRGDSKQAGDWGELVLNELLDSQGFKRGFDYDVQSTMMDAEGNILRNEDTGSRMRPDVVLHYPGNQDVIIDAKVSIKAYYDYVNETSEAVKAQMLDRHVQSLRSHVKELIAKDYSRYIMPPRTAIDFVIMYVPNEMALQVALAHDPKLWSDAFEKKIFISSTQNLFAILRMIQIAWRQHRQTENQKKIVSLAEQLLSRIGLFVERAQKLGRDIDLLHTDFDDLQKSINGRLSIVQKANELKQLGVKEDAKHPIPQQQEDFSSTTKQNTNDLCVE